MPELTKIQTGFLEPQGPFKLDPGTESAPGIYLEGDENTGLYRSAENEIAVTVDGTQKFKFTSEGLKFNGTSLDGTPFMGAIDKDITDTAVDVFVYDTSRDSDGGAWRKRTQNTSWYNETLNTATRGSRREFPAVAVIVAETAKVTIYDGDDPDLPMWMVFNSTATRSFLGYTIDPKVTSIKAINAEICIGSSSELNEVNFLRDNSLRIGSTASWYTRNNISQRNVNFSSFSDIGLRTVTGGRYNIAMTVLPNAPIDPDTGLPTPTIAVGTDGGISIIKDDGNIYDSSDTDPYGSMEFNGQRLISSRETSQVRFFISQEMRTITADGFSLYESYMVDSTGYPRLLTDSGYGLVSKHSDFAARGGSLGVTLWDWDKSSQSEFQDFNTESSIAHISASYNTGWQHGDIKGAFLSDTDDTDVTGTELITNGSFTTNTDNWTANGATLPTLSVDTNRLKLTHNGANGGAYQNITTVVGETYVISADLTNGNASSIRLRAYGDGSTGDGFQGTNYIGDSITSTSATSTSLTLVAETTTTRIYVEILGTNAEYAFADNVVARIADPDRSVNNNGLQVFGTITKSAVATGADLVSYSGFSGSNYLEQPYNSALDFGTGDFSFISWVKHPNTFNASEHSHVISKNNPEAYGQFTIQYGTDSTLYLRSNASNYANIGALSTNIWQQIAFVRRGGVLYGYKDGNLIATNNFTDNISNNESLRVGYRNSGYAGSWSGSLALLRVSASAPSAEQIKKIYEDEKWLFQENANATLYGSSDAVTALAYDEKTNLLHVGTSSGRSDFNGLRRINNTTEAVTTAISAYDGSIAQQ